MLTQLTSSRRALATLVLVLASSFAACSALAAGPDVSSEIIPRSDVMFPAPGACVGALCAWATGDARLGSTLHAEVDEVAPESWAADALTLSITNASRSGTFYFSTEAPLEVAGPMSFSMWVRSDGPLDRFPILFREEGFAGWEANRDAGDAVVFIPATSGEWRFVSWLWTPVHADTTAVRLALRGEVQAGASATIAFAEISFTSDGTRWFLNSEAEPFAFGPRAAWRFEAPASHVIRAVGAASTTRFTRDGPEVEAQTRIVASASPVLPGGARLLAADVSHAFQPERLDGGLRGWHLAPIEAGERAAVAIDGDTLTVSVPAVRNESSVWLERAASWIPGQPVELVWRARDDRTLLRYEPVILESDGTRHVMSATAGGPLGTSGVLRFTPHTDGGHVQLRFIVTPGIASTVTWTHVSMREAFTYQWRVDGRNVGTGPIVDIPFDRAAAHVVSVVAKGRWGTPGESNMTLPMNVDFGEPPLRIREGPLVARVGVPVALDASPTWETSFNALPTSADWREWVLESGEAPGTFAWGVTADGARLAAGPMGETAGGGLQRVIAAPAGNASRDLTFRYRTEGDVDRVQVVVRYHTPGDFEYAEVRANYTPSDDLRTVALAVPAPQEGRSIMLVGLRAIVLENHTGVVTFANVTLAPGASYVWSGAQGVGPVASIVAPSTGLMPWSVRVTLPGGWVGVQEGVIGATAPVTPFVPLSEGVSARWDPVIFPANVSIRLEGPASAEGPASLGTLSTRVFSPGAYSVIATSDGGQRVVLGSATLQSRTGLAVASWNATRREPMIIALPLANPDLIRVTAHFAGGVRSEDVQLIRTDGAWRGVWTPDLAWAPGDVEMTLSLEDAAGATLTQRAAQIHLVATTGDPAGAGSVLVLMLAVAAAAWAPRARRGYDELLVAALCVGGHVLGAVLAVGTIVPSMALGADHAVMLGVVFTGMIVTASIAARFVPWPVGGLRREVVHTVAISGAALVLTLLIITSWHDVGPFRAFPRRALFFVAPLSAAFTSIIFRVPSFWRRFR